MNLEKLYGKTKAGKIKIWEIYVSLHTDGTASYTTIHGLIDGQQTESTQIVSEGKNIGKSNETSCYEQAVSEAKSRWQKQIDAGYSTTIDGIKTGDDREYFLPMLAARYDQKSKKIKWPCAIQIKYDGHRCLARKEDGEVTIWSRKGKTLDVPKEIIAELKDIMNEGDYFDGELYNHAWRSDSGAVDFQRITSAIKKYGQDTASLEYIVYDVPDSTQTFQDRFINKEFKTSSRIIKAPTYIVNDEKSAMEIYEQWITQAEPYEGAMLRNLKGYYQYDHRSDDLQKVKPQDDAEFKIVGGIEATGNDIGTVVFICETENGLQFKVRPIGSRESRREYWDNLSSYIGKKITVSYNGLTNDLIPRFPRGIKLRPDWDV